MSSISRALRRIPTTAWTSDRSGGRFLILSAATGVVVGVGASALVELIELIGRGLADLGLGGGSLWLLVAVPVGFLASWLIAHRLADETMGDGVPEAISALVVRGGAIRGRVAPLKILTTAFTLGVGGSGGREGPIVLIGASIGSKISRVFDLGEDQVRSLVAAGAGAGIGAAFNAPIAGMLFALEVILSSFAVRHMSAIVVASVTAAITSRSLVGEDLVLDSSTAYRMGDPRELLLYAGMTLVIVAASVGFLRLLEALEDWLHHGARRFRWWRPVGFGILTALLIVIEPALTGGEQTRLFGTGQEVINHLLATAQGVATITSDVSGLWWVLGLLAVGKIVATSFTLASGASGGAFMPSLFIGAVIGTAFAKLIGPFWSLSPLSTGSFAVVGMAAMFAAMARAPLTAILLVFEITGTREYGLILPLMLSGILATYLAERFHADSVYTMPLRRRGIVEARRGEVDILDTVDVSQVMSPARVIAREGDGVREVEAELHRHRAHGAPVVDREGRLVGIITTSDMTGSDRPDDAKVGDFMTRRPVTVTPSTEVSHAMARMAAMAVGRLPVVADDDPGLLVGVFRREDAVRAYHQALGSHTDHRLQRARLAQRTDPGAGYYDFRIPAGSIAEGRAVRDVNWPEGSTLVSVRRRLDVLVPVGSTVLEAEDVVTAFGSDSSRQIMIERLNAGADEPTAEIELDLEVGPSRESRPSRLEGPTDSGVSP